MEEKTKKFVALGMSALVLGLGGFAVGANTVDPVVIKEMVAGPTVYVDVPGPVEYITETVFQDKEVIVEVPVNPKELVDYIVDESGDLTALDIGEIDDYGYDELISQVAFIQESKLMAADYVKREMARELDRYNFNATIKFDDRDIERVRVDDDLDELAISSVDFDDLDAFVKVRSRFEHDDINFEAYFDVEIRDGLVEDFSLDSISTI